MHTVNIFDDCFEQFYNQSFNQFYEIKTASKPTRRVSITSSVLQEYAEYLGEKYDCTYSLDFFSRNFILEFKDPEQLALFKLENMQ